MSITGGLVLYATLWFLVMFLLLPIGHQSQEEAGQVVPGTPVGAPMRPMMGRKALWAASSRRPSWGASGCSWNPGSSPGRT